LGDGISSKLIDEENLGASLLPQDAMDLSSFLLELLVDSAWGSTNGIITASGDFNETEA